MGALWLTYAWKDNQDQDVDFVIAELEKRGVEVRYDRVELLAGKRLWEQIDAGISNPEVSAWAMLVTENSLQSEPCLEEIAYALDRALRTKGSEFPLIGIFPGPVDRAIIPSALATRLYVNLSNPGWADRIVGSLSGAQSRAPVTPPAPFGLKIHRFESDLVVEVWPRAGRWFPFTVAVPTEQRELLKTVLYGPRDGITGAAMINTSDGRSADGSFMGQVIHHAITAETSGHIFLSGLPERLMFGPADGPTFILSKAQILAINQNGSPAA
jgi:hypothetical protein